MKKDMKLEEFDSKEEFHFYHWLLEAEENNLVSDCEYHLESSLLSRKVKIEVPVKMKTKTKVVAKHLLNAHIYTPDFTFRVKNHAIESVFKVQLIGKYQESIIVDVKGCFGGRNNSSATTFPLNQKWVYQQAGLYVQKVIPEEIFKETWVPEEARLTPKKREHVKKYIKCLTVKEFVAINCKG
jgi:hypothetical protein